MSKLLTSRKGITSLSLCWEGGVLCGSGEGLLFERVPGCMELLASDGLGLKEVSSVNHPYGNSFPFFFLQVRFSCTFFGTPCGIIGSFSLSQLRRASSCFVSIPTALQGAGFLGTEFVECPLAQSLKIKLFILS